jgi:hypothetical protein
MGKAEPKASDWYRLAHRGIDTLDGILAVMQKRAEVDLKRLEIEQEEEKRRRLNYGPRS